MDTFNPPRQPDQRSEVDTEFNTLEAPFGDGYEQSAPAGLNSERQTWNLSWSALTESEKDQILSFLRSQGGYKTFLWTPPGESSDKKWRCKKFKLASTGDLYRVSASFKQQFTL